MAQGKRQPRETPAFPPQSGMHSLPFGLTIELAQGQGQEPAQLLQTGQPIGSPGIPALQPSTSVKILPFPGFPPSRQYSA